MHKTAIISEDQNYRYFLSRTWAENEHARKVCTFVMLNPSTADAEKDDNTIRKCIKYAKAWGCDALFVVNLFGYRATDPKDLKLAAMPVGRENDYYLLAACGAAQTTGGPIVCAWGAHGFHRGRSAQVLEALRPNFKLHALTVSKKTGQPGHPLYLSDNLKPQPFEG